MTFRIQLWGGYLHGVVNGSNLQRRAHTSLFGFVIVSACNLKSWAFLNILAVTGVGYFHQGFLHKPHLNFWEQIRFEHNQEEGQ